MGAASSLYSRQRSKITKIGENKREGGPSTWHVMKAALLKFLPFGCHCAAGVIGMTG